MPLPSLVWLQWKQGNSYAKYCYKCTPLLINSVEQNAPWEADTSQVVKAYPGSYGTQKVRYLFTGHHLPLSRVRLIQATHYHYISPRLILIFLSLLHLGLQSTLFPSGFPTKTLYVLLVCSMHGVCSANLILLPLIVLTIQQISFIPVLSTAAGKGCV